MAQLELLQLMVVVAGPPLPLSVAQRAEVRSASERSADAVPPSWNQELPVLSFAQ
jgi:hypothetical protein